jgi:hypothetical protein
MNIIDNEIMTTMDHKRTVNRMKRKISLTNSEIIHTTTKKLDVIKSTEFEPREQYEFRFF